MAKLTSQQIDVIANKALRTLTKNAEEARLVVIKNYEPSENYNELEIKLKDF